MNKILTILLLISFTSTNAQVEVELSFWDECLDSVINLEYEIYDFANDSTYKSNEFKVILPSKGFYMLDANIVSTDTDYLSYVISESNSFLFIEDTNFYTDTVCIPKIRRTFSTALHSSNWNYFNCNNLSNGKEISYYFNGNKHIEGKFIDGKPYELVEYRRNGIIYSKYYYKVGDFDFQKAEYYNDSGSLEELKINSPRKQEIEYYDSLGNIEKIEVYQRRKKRKIVKYFDEYGKLIEKEIKPSNKKTKHNKL
ncbi:hypothetical protein [Flammeovirga sp. OC4]|uniref:hypothetical protein n=1 Tax=Flammeovirga sp. OC4 TaxID=1382345 RepID=UPI0005C6CA25|nr:hypothetical protein [Flammeovirga sp. OC4]